MFWNASSKFLLSSHWRWETVWVTLLEVGLQKFLWASKSSYHFTGRRILIPVFSVEAPGSIPRVNITFGSKLKALPPTLVAPLPPAFPVWEAVIHVCKVPSSAVYQPKDIIVFCSCFTFNLSQTFTYQYYYPFSIAHCRRDRMWKLRMWRKGRW